MPLAHQPEPDERPMGPLGKPVNRKPEPELTPIAGRPNWFVDKQGREKYVEPPRKVDVYIPPVYIQPVYSNETWPFNASPTVVPDGTVVSDCVYIVTDEDYNVDEFGP